METFQNTINAAIQVLPLIHKGNKYQLIDKAIEVIKKSGLIYEVCPFETVIEGPYDKIMEVLKKMQEVCYSKGASELIINIKLHTRKNEDVFIEEKLAKYR